MKKINLFFISVAVFSAVFSSCKKDSEEPTVVSISFQDAADNPLEKDIELTDTVFKFAISSDQQAVGNITATIQADLSLVDRFNEDNQTTYLPMVDGSFTLSGNRLTISNGALNSDMVELLITPKGRLERENSYLLPIVITSVTGNGKIYESKSVNYFVISVNKAKEVVLQDVNRSAWEILGSSEETVGEGSGQGKAIYLLDNNAFTFWHSQYIPTASEYPHWLSIDMKAEYDIRAFWIVHCQESWATSIPKDMYFEVSSDNTNWTRVGEFSATSSLEKQVFTLEETVKASYFRVTFENSISGEIYCYLGELGASAEVEN